MVILGIETSCDETAVAVVDDNKTILSHQLVSQLDQHKDYGGVVPEIAARSHISILPTLFQKALKDAALSIKEIDAVAVTAGPGLIGGVMIGLMFAKGIAASSGMKFIPINHLEGHALTARLTSSVDFPYLLLLLSGGHCQILVAESVGVYKKLGETLDDSIGEAFDKVAKMLNLGYPGGAEIEKKARDGDEARFKFPMPMCREDNCDFSFSGLKTAVKNQIQSINVLDEQVVADVCASLQYTIIEILKNKLSSALTIFKEHYHSKNVVIGGGVAANRAIYESLNQFLLARDMNLFVPPPHLCTDNAAMIAWAGVERLRLGLVDLNNMNFAAKSRWPLWTL